MHEKPDLEQTDELPSAPADSLDAGLAAGFGNRLGAPRSSLGDMRPVLLREAEGESSHVVKPNSDAMPQKSHSGDRYQLSGEIARGGMGAVLRGRDVDLGRDLAVKVLLEKYANRPKVTRRFIEEAQIGGQLQHPGIVPVYDIGRFGDRPFFTMKLVKGLTLAALLSERTDPSADRPRLLAIALQVAQTLAYAHAKGVIHRDLKPANIMVGAFGEVQVMDWGLAKVLAEGGIADEERAKRAQEQPTDVTVIRTARSTGSTGSFGSDTEAGSLLGTPAYMPPEQANGDVALLDRRADVFGLGAILCEILTGKAPYVGRSGEEVRRKAANGDLADAHAGLDACGADAELIALTRKCLAPEAVDRPKDAQAVAESLTEYLDGVQARLHKAELAEAEARARAVEEVKRRRVTLALAATVLAAVTLGGGGWLWIKADRDARMAQVTRDVNEALNRATAFREQAKVANVGSAALFAQAREQTQRALALVQSGPADMALTEQVKLLQSELDEEEKDRQLIAALDEARLAQAETVTGENRFASEQAVPLFREALRAYGLPVGEGEPEAATERIRQRPAAVREALLATLDEWLALSTNPTLKLTEPHLDWLRAVAEATEPADGWTRQLRAAREEKDPGKQREATAKLATSADVRVLPARALTGLAPGLSPAPRVELLRRGQAQYPADFWVNHDPGISLQNVTPPEQAEAVRFLTAAVALRPDSPGAHYNLGRALETSDRLNEAFACYRRAIELDPKYVAAHFQLGDALRDNAQFDEAIACQQRAIELFPESADAHNKLGLTLSQVGQVEQAITSFQRAIELDPKDAKAHSNLGNELFTKGLLDEAIASQRKAVAVAPNYAPAHGNLGFALQRTGQVDEAITCYRRAIELDPKLVEVHNNLGNALQAKGQLDEAIACYRLALELDPMYANALVGMGNIQKANGQLNEAIASYRQAIALNPKSAAAHSNLGLSLQAKGLFDEAIASQRQSVDIDPKDARSQLNLGVALFEKSLWDEAIISFKKAIELNPKFVPAHNGLGAALASRGLLDEGIISFKKAIELNPKAAWVRTNLAEVEQMARGRDKLHSYQNGSYTPASADDYLGLAQWCKFKKLHHTAAGLYAAAFADDAKSANDLKTGYRYNAACQAALSAAGQGEDAANLEGQEQARLRKQALDWLRADLVAYSKQLEEASTPPVRTFVLQQLVKWQQDGDLSSIRDEAALAKLSVEEREAFTQLWADVAALLKKASTSPTQEPKP